MMMIKTINLLRGEDDRGGGVLTSTCRLESVSTSHSRSGDISNDSQFQIEQAPPAALSHRLYQRPSHFNHAFSKSSYFVPKLCWIASGSDCAAASAKSKRGTPSRL